MSAGSTLPVGDSVPAAGSLPTAIAHIAVDHPTAHEPTDPVGHDAIATTEVTR
jgi:hypothetical protein